MFDNPWVPSKDPTCPACKATYMAGTPHTCDHTDFAVARNRLETWLGNWTLEPTS